MDDSDLERTEAIASDGRLTRLVESLPSDERVAVLWLSVWAPHPQGFSLVGVVKPSVGRDGKLAAEGLLPRGASGAYQVLITLQPGASASAPGRTVLEGSVDF